VVQCYPGVLGVSYCGSKPGLMVGWSKTWISSLHCKRSAISYEIFTTDWPLSVRIRQRLRDLHHPAVLNFCAQFVRILRVLAGYSVAQIYPRRPFFFFLII
jgi:hypothetical protein